MLLQSLRQSYASTYPQPDARPELELTTDRSNCIVRRLSICVVDWVRFHDI